MEGQRKTKKDNINYKKQEVVTMAAMVPFRRNADLKKRDDFWDIDNIFDNFFNDSFLMPTVFAPTNYMRADIKEKDNEYVIDVEIPGVKKEDIKLDLSDDDVLTVSVEKKEEAKDEGTDYIRREIRYGAYSRSFYVPGIKEEGITAKYDNGLLTITLPKAEEAKAKRKAISIE